MGKARIIIALLIAAFSAIGYYANTTVNPITGEKQRVGGMSAQQEVAMGLQSAPGMAREFGGVSSNQKATALVKTVGNKIVAQSVAASSTYAKNFQFHLLADARTINAFALPGGQIFITEALLSKLRTEGQLAAVLGHEVGHVLARHSAEHMAQQKLQQGLVTAAGVGAGGEAAQIANQVATMKTLSYGRDDELEADQLGMRLSAEAGYDPSAMIGVMEILAKAAGGNRQSEWGSSHPAPENRAKRAADIIRDKYPSGVPAGLIK